MRERDKREKERGKRLVEREIGRWEEEVQSERGGEVEGEKKERKKEAERKMGRAK